MFKKSAMWFAAGALFVILMSHILRIPILIPLVTVVICAALLLYDLKTATCLLFFFSPFSYILSYSVYNLYIFLAVAYIARVLFGKFRISAIAFSAVVLLYCVLFASQDVGVKIGHLIFPILLLMVIFVCQKTEVDWYRPIIHCFLVGFVLSAFVGFFKEQIPSIFKLFEENPLFIQDVEESMNIERFSGISYDPNFFTLIDSLLIAYLLFCNQKLSVVKILTLAFLIVVGFFTFSKSYFLLLLGILLVYVFRNAKHVFKKVMLLGSFVLALFLVEIIFDLELLNLMTARFSTADGINDLTTGRSNIWLNYFEYIFTHAKCLFLGDGYNALSLGKAAHNSYIDMLYRFGLVGVTMWVAYFVQCYKNMPKLQEGQKSTKIPFWVMMIAIAFLSTFHFQQLWCCVCVALFTMRMPMQEQAEKEEVCQS